MTTAKVFISYRRDDSAGYAGRVHDRLAQEFGRDLLFMDVDAVPLGANFIRILRQEVAKCDVLLAVIGPNWVNARDDQGNRRLESATDFVRVEIATALQRDIPVIPILLDGARLPKADQLPTDLQELTVRNGLDVRHVSFHTDMDRLIRGLKNQPGSPKATREATAPTKRAAPPAAAAGRIDDIAANGGKATVSIKMELRLAAIGTIAGIAAGALFLTLAGLIFSELGPAKVSNKTAGGIITGTPVFIVGVAVATLAQRQALLDSRGWHPYARVACIAFLTCVWCGVTYVEVLMPVPRRDFDTPGFIFGYIIFAVSIFSLLIVRLKHHQSITVH